MNYAGTHLEILDRSPHGGGTNSNWKLIELDFNKCKFPSDAHSEFPLQVYDIYTTRRKNIKKP